MIVAILLIILGTIFQTPVMFKTGQMYDFGIGYWGPLARDGIWHEALAGQLKLAVPPQNPGFAGTILTNYHYLYDLLVAWTSILTKLSDSLLIYRVFPILFSLLMGLGTYLLAKRLFNNKFITWLSVFFVYFGSSFGWIVSLVKRQPLGGESAFWANQPVSMNLNPPFAISLVLLIFSLLILDSYLKKPKILTGGLLVIILGTLIGFKAYAGAIAIAALFCLTVKKIYFDRNFVLIPIFILTFALTLAIYLTGGKGSYHLIAVQPFWLIDTMIDAGDRVGIPNFTARRFAYIGGGKWPNLLVIEAISFLIFFIGNLGTRILGWWGFDKKRIKSDLYIFIIFLMIASFLPPLIFVQQGNPWNIIQFFYYFLYFSSLLAAVAVVKIYKLLPRWLGIVMIVALVLVTPLSSFATFRSWLYPKPPAYLSKDEYAALSFLKGEPQGAVLVHPFDQSLRGNYHDPYPLPVYAESAYVSAFSGHPSFLEDTEQQLILGVNYVQRLSDAKLFFTNKDVGWSSQFLKSNSIDYVYLPKRYYLPQAEAMYPMKTIFENSEVKIYKVLQ